MHVVFLHGPPAAGKHTVGLALSRLTGLPLFHNHLAVDAAKSLFAFGSDGFNRIRATVWREAFSAAADAQQSFIFTFHPERTVAPAFIDDVQAILRNAGGRIHFVQLTCSHDAILQRIANTSRTRFGKLTDPSLYSDLLGTGTFTFPALPAPLLVIDTEATPPDSAAEQIARALPDRPEDA